MESFFFPYYLSIGGDNMNQDILRKKIKEYLNSTGIKQKFFAEMIGENPNNFSRWITGKRNYGKEREEQIKKFLIDKGWLYDTEL